MYIKTFSLKIEDVALHFQAPNLIVSSAFNKSEIIELIIQKLSEIKYIPDLDSLNYLIKEGQLYVEGIAFEKQPDPEFDFTF